MYNQVLFKAILVMPVVAACVPAYAEPSSQNTQFYCSLRGNNPTTLIRTSRGDIPLISWIDNTFPPPWNPKRRCEEISRKMQQFQDNGTLSFLKGSMLNGQPVLCVAGFRGGPCLANGVLVTLSPTANPQRTLERLLNRRQLAAGNPIGLQGFGKFIFREENETFFSLKGFLDEMEKHTDQTSF
jgi:hypothetical protein